MVAFGSYKESIIEDMNVTSPLLPDLKELHSLLEEIWSNEWVTNNGIMHQRLEKALREYLHVPALSIFTNGTMPLVTALQYLGIKGEVITTPYSFVATTHAIRQAGCKPVFVDVDPITGNIDPDCIENAITDMTTAILTVHVYGNPCDTESIRSIADKHGLKVIYDAAHAFGVERDGKSILTEGDLSTLSFHATKVYNTMEGGAIVMNDGRMQSAIERLKDFGIVGEEEIEGFGLNGKMDEVRAAYGLLNLKTIESAMSIRKEMTMRYRDGLRNVEGIRFMENMPNVKHNYSYFPIFVDEERYGMNRNALFEALNSADIRCRKYFYPLISDVDIYSSLPTSGKENLPNAHKLAESVICLPMHHKLEAGDVDKVVDVIKMNVK